MIRRPVPPDRVPAGWRGEGGLETAEAAARRARFGDNHIVETPPGGVGALLRDTLRDPMLWFLAATSLLYLAVGQRVEAATLLGALAPLIAMDLVLHRRTQASTEALASRLAETARALRDGAWIALHAAALVPGDLVRVSPGEPFPADGVLVSGEALQADEAILTGEAFPVAKRPLAADPAGAPVADAHWGFAGTRLLTGTALLRVVFTGGETLYGEIVRSAVAGAHAPTPLQRAIRRLVGVLVAAAGVMCVVIAWARLSQGHGWLDALVSAVTLASAALPEEFPVVFTFFLGVGVYRLARRHALVRRAVSVESIGGVSCICSDKTGTITEGRLSVTHLVPAPGLDTARLLALAAGASRGDSGDPLDAAIIAAAGPGDAVAVAATFPFTETVRRESAVVRERDGQLTAVAKGALETILGMCEPTADGTGWTARMRELAEDGHKVIACAWRPVDAAAWRGEEIAEGYRLAGLVALEDPVRDGVAASVARCREAGIHTIMVTGDHPITARAVAREIGLGGATPRVVAGEDVERLAAAGGDGLRAVDVVARAAPAQKLALVRGLQAAGEVVAVTGDGVNDVPALQAADIGVAMGARGTRSAREVASIVLLDDDFSTIVRAIAEGRQLFENLRRSFLYLLMIHIPLVLTAAFVPLAGYPLLYLPIHIVWLELVIHPTALLVFQELPAGEELTPARRVRPKAFFSAGGWLGVAAVGALLTALVTTAYLTGLAGGGDVHARALALAVLTLASAALTATLSGLRTPTAWAVTLGTVALTLLLVQTPLAAQLLHLGPLHLDDWALTAGGALVVGLLARPLATLPG
jgi:Ca2+-transporting ATPase